MLFIATPTTVTAPVFSFLSSNIGYPFVTDRKSHVSVLGGFNVHNLGWMVHSSDTLNIGRKQFEVADSLSQLRHLSTRKPDQSGGHAHTLDVILITLSLCTDIPIRPPLGSSDHCIITPFTSLTCQNPPPSLIETF